MGLDGIPNRIASYFKDAPATALRAAGITIGLHLSRSQATTVGLHPEPQVYELTGSDYAEAIAKAEGFIADNFPGCVL